MLNSQAVQKIQIGGVHLKTLKRRNVVVLTLWPGVHLLWSKKCSLGCINFYIRSLLNVQNQCSTFNLSDSIDLSQAGVVTLEEVGCSSFHLFACLLQLLVKTYDICDMYCR